MRKEGQKQKKRDFRGVKFLKKKKLKTYTDGASILSEGRGGTSLSDGRGRKNTGKKRHPLEQLIMHRRRRGRNEAGESFAARK